MSLLSLTLFCVPLVIVASSPASHSQLLVVFVQKCAADSLGYVTLSPSGGIAARVLDRWALGFLTINTLRGS